MQTNKPHSFLLPVPCMILCRGGPFHGYAQGQFWGQSEVVQGYYSSHNMPTNKPVLPSQSFHLPVTAVTILEAKHDFSGSYATYPVQASLCPYLESNKSSKWHLPVTMVKNSWTCTQRSCADVYQAQPRCCIRLHTVSLPYYGKPTNPSLAEHGFQSPVVFRTLFHRLLCMSSKIGSPLWCHIRLFSTCNPTTLSQFPLSNTYPLYVLEGC